MHKEMVMKSIGLIGMVTAALLLTVGVLTAGAAQAEENHEHSIINQHISKRPYQAPSPDASANKAEHWEGATLVKDEAHEEKAGPTQYQQLRIRMLGQRPYLEGNK